ncbi:hypothetical protein NQZ68_000457 [Dissostichus eleginoides]|nr:hypothetical protein NQZ68_000457 [Dissostichus eleginoides]
MDGVGVDAVPGRVAVFVGAGMMWRGPGTYQALSPGAGLRVSDGRFERICNTLSVGQGGPVFISPFIHPSSFPPPPAHHHLPASHHQCSQGDERHGEEGPQGINFSHGWESSSQKT